MTSSQENNDVTAESHNEDNDSMREFKECLDSLHKRRRGEPPATLAVHTPTTLSDAEGSTPCTAGLTPEDVWLPDKDHLIADPGSFCDGMLKRLEERNDPLSFHGKQIAQTTKNTVEGLDHLEKLLGVIDQILNLKKENSKILQRLRDVNQLKRMHEAHKQIELETSRLRAEHREIQMLNEALDSEYEAEYSQGEALLNSMLSSGRSVKRSGSRWKSHSKFGGSLLRKQRSRSAGGDDSDAPISSRRRSEGVANKVVEKSKWTRVKSVLRWEKAQWSSVGGAAGAVAAGAMVGAVALAGSSPPSQLPDAASLTPGSMLSLTPNSSCEELRLDSDRCRKSGAMRGEDGDNYLQAPMQDDSSASPSPNKLHKSAWDKMREIIQPRRESVRKKCGRSSKSSPEVVLPRRRSFSDGGDSDVPPALTLTIPSSEELESESPHPLLRKQRSLEMGARPPQHRPPRASKWTKVKRAFLTSPSASVPSSPNRHSAFFTDADTEGLSSGCEAGSGVREEIARDYAALQSKLRREFSDRRGKLYSASRPVATEEQLSADFRKKLAEWQKMKGGSIRQPPPVPARQDLSDDFLKKWDEWKHMKETNSVPAWGEEAKPDEVLVQTSTGLFKFQGISRSFTRKLHEWEKSRGIAPEASTSALLRAARAKVPPSAPALTRTQSAGSVAPSTDDNGRLYSSSLSVNDADDFDLEFKLNNDYLDGDDICDGQSSRGAVLVEVEAEEVCTAAPLVAVSPMHTAQKPVYTYGHAEARLLCETRSAVTGTAVIQPNGTDRSRNSKTNNKGSKTKTPSREQSMYQDKGKRRLVRQPSLEEDAMFIRKTIEEIEKGRSTRYDEGRLKEINESLETDFVDHKNIKDNVNIASTSKLKNTDDKRINEQDIKIDRNEHGITKGKESFEDKGCPSKNDDKVKDPEKSNGKKKTKSRARLEREQSKPSETDTEPDVDTVTVEIPKRRKRPRKISDKPRTPPTSVSGPVSDSEGEIFVLKLNTESHDVSPEVIVKTTRKIFSPVVRSGETVPKAVIPVSIEDLDIVTPSMDSLYRFTDNEEVKTRNDHSKKDKSKEDFTMRCAGSGDLCEGEDLRPSRRPPLPLSPSAQRRPQVKETAPSIRIMIQRYNMKIKEEEGHTSGASSGASSPAWRSPALERRRPIDMPVGVNIRSNPFLEREVQKSVSACQLSSKLDHASVAKRLEAIPQCSMDGVLKSHSACTLHSVEAGHPINENSSPQAPPKTDELLESSKDKINNTASTDTIVQDLSMNTPNAMINRSEIKTGIGNMNVLKQMSDTFVPKITKTIVGNSSSVFGRSVSAIEPQTRASTSTEKECSSSMNCSERARRIKEARERFLSSPEPSRIRRNGTGSASDLRPGDRCSRISCESDVAEGSTCPRDEEGSALSRSASTGMVNVDREAWVRVAEGDRRTRSPRSRFSLARWTAKLRGREDGAISRLCRQSLLVQLKNKP